MDYSCGMCCRYVLWIDCGCGCMLWVCTVDVGCVCCGCALWMWIVGVDVCCVYVAGVCGYLRVCPGHPSSVCSIWAQSLSSLGVPHTQAAWWRPVLVTCRENPRAGDRPEGQSRRGIKLTSRPVHEWGVGVSLRRMRPLISPRDHWTQSSGEHVILKKTSHWDIMCLTREEIWKVEMFKEHIFSEEILMTKRVSELQPKNFLEQKHHRKIITTTRAELDRSSQYM